MDEIRREINELYDQIHQDIDNHDTESALKHIKEIRNLEAPMIVRLETLKLIRSKQEERNGINSNNGKKCNGRNI